ncbi:TatD family hydrolase [Pseudopedobacter sp.]|uniref:TatD family hydrolase n=1 Tax=Pseudopedobacter sp. TaxID=1936787 RepID=UPI003340564C
MAAELLMIPSGEQFINIHSHRKAVSADEWVLRNAFHVLDGYQIGRLNYAVSVGVHPWYIDSDFEQNIAQIESLLQLNNVLALGEIGLDRAVNIDFKLQKHVFEIQLQLAEEYNKPVIIHSVRTYSDLAPYLKKIKVPVILHQYRGNETQTQQFISLENVFFSFGKDLIFNKKVKTIFQSMPLNRIFLETDVFAMNIQDIYKQATILSGKDIGILKEYLYQSFLRIFSNSK